MASCLCSGPFQAARHRAATATDVRCRSDATGPSIPSQAKTGSVSVVCKALKGLVLLSVNLQTIRGALPLLELITVVIKSLVIPTIASLAPGTQ